ncbi:MAG TPA: hypothetical protein DIT76_00925 [Spartobacteria bacterium]|nr:hypothetical protein [Spartobacteria bacterium]
MLAVALEAAEEGIASGALGLGATVGCWANTPVASAIAHIQTINSVFIVFLAGEMVSAAPLDSKISEYSIRHKN